MVIQTAGRCFVWISEETGTYAWYYINRLLFISEGG